MTATEPNPYEAANRAAKVLSLTMQARTARDGRGFTAEEMAGFSDHEWELLAEAAGCNPPSRVTREMVVRVASYWSDRNQPDDPWEGVTR